MMDKRFIFLFFIFLIAIFFNLLLLEPDNSMDIIEACDPYDDVLFISLQIIQGMSAGVIPGAVTEFIGGYLFGPVRGIIYSMVGIGIGSLLAFVISRVYGLSLVSKIIDLSIIPKCNHFIKKRDSLLTFILFLIPGFPKSALCYLLGLGRINFWTFLFISNAGRLLGTVLLSMCGSHFRQEEVIPSVTTVLSLAAIFLLAYLYFFNSLGFGKVFAMLDGGITRRNSSLKTREPIEIAPK